MKVDAIITLCKEYSRDNTRRQYLAVCKALDALQLTGAERLEMEQRWGFRDDTGALYQHLEKQPRQIKAKKFDWSNVR